MQPPRLRGARWGPRTPRGPGPGQEEESGRGASVGVVLGDHASGYRGRPPDAKGWPRMWSIHHGTISGLPLQGDATPGILHPEVPEIQTTRLPPLQRHRRPCWPAGVDPAEVTTTRIMSQVAAGLGARYIGPSRSISRTRHIGTRGAPQRGQEADAAVVGDPASHGSAVPGQMVAEDFSWSSTRSGAPPRRMKPVRFMGNSRVKDRSTPGQTCWRRVSARWDALARRATPPAPWCTSYRQFFRYPGEGLAGGQILRPEPGPEPVCATPKGVEE